MGGLREITGWIDNWRKYAEVGRNKETIGGNLKMIGEKTKNRRKFKEILID